MSYTVTIDDKLGLDASVRPLEWTTEKPTKPGWYWVFPVAVPTDNGEYGKPSMVYFDGKSLPLADGEYGFPLEWIAGWLGPLPEPPAPK